MSLVAILTIIALAVMLGVAACCWAACWLINTLDRGE